VVDRRRWFAGCCCDQRSARPTADRDGTYRIRIEGEPALSCELQVGTADTFSLDGMLATTMRVVNAIPFVCDAAPGIVTSASLPLTLPRFAFDHAF